MSTGRERNRPQFISRKANEEDASIREDAALDDSAGTSYIYNNSYVSLSIQQQQTRLPIFAHKNQMIYMVQKYQTVVVVGETGCGKSTQLPQYLANAGCAYNGKQICVTQPRRVAAITLASRVADEMMCMLGSEVGYSVRFDDVYSEKTKIKFMTDGMLLMELANDPLLNSYSVIMVDEAHERSINTDLLIGFLRKIITFRNDLRIIISSATIDAEFFRDYFDLNETNNSDKSTASIVSVEGRTFPVNIFYTKCGVPDYVKATTDLVMKIHRTEGSGDILAFLTGQDEVDRVCDNLRSEIRAIKKAENVDNLIIAPLYSGLPPREQLRAFDSTPYRTRKVVVATNIAETSVTIPGVCFVIDCGFVKMRLFNVKSDLETLMVVSCSQSSADQRAGRAGRVRPGKCFRLYPESEYEKLLPKTVPEIQRGELASVILKLKSLGVQNFLNFNYLSRPSASSMIRALHLLYAIGAIDDNGLLTHPIGFQMSELPLPPMCAKALISSDEYECSSEVATIVAMMQIQDVFTTPAERRHKAEVSRRKFAVEEGDHITLLNVFTEFVKNGRSQAWCKENYVSYKALCRSEKIRGQLLRYMYKYKKKIASCEGTIASTAKIRRCLLSGFFPQVARYDHTGMYVTIHGENSFKAYKGSAIMYRKEFPKWVMFSDVLQNSIRHVSEIELSWLEQVAQHYYDFGSSNGLSRKSGNNVAEGRLANIN